MVAIARNIGRKRAAQLAFTGDIISARQALDWGLVNAVAPAGVATDADVNFSTPSDTLPLAAEHPRKVVKLAEQYGVTSSIGRLQKALDGLPG